MFSESFTDRITVKTNDGKTFSDVAASVHGNKVTTDRTDIPLRQGDQISRTTPAGVEENFIIEDPGFQSGVGDLPDIYHMRIRPEPTGPKRPNDPIPGTPEEVERDIDYWTDQLAECSGGSERAYAIDTRLRRLARAKERLGSAVQDTTPGKPVERADKKASNIVEIMPSHPMYARIEKTVFISYRRIAVSWAQSIFQDLTQHGYDVFFDFHGIASGAFEEVILENIKARAHFLVLLTPSALERCSDPADLFRREIETAIAWQRNIVPIMLEGFDFGAPEIDSQLGDALAALKRYNGLPVYAAYFPEAMLRLRDKYLNVPLNTVLHPVSRSAAQAAKDEQAAAANAPAATERELREAARERYLFTVKIAYQDELERVEGTHAEEPYGPGSLIIYDGDSVVARYSSADRWSRQQRKAERDMFRDEVEGTSISTEERDRRQIVLDKLRNADRSEIDLLAHLTRDQSISVSTIRERGWIVAVNGLMQKGLVPEPNQGDLSYHIHEKLVDAVKYYLEASGSL